MKLASDMAALPSLATGMALHVRVRDIADAGAFDAMPSIATSSMPAAIATASGASVQARGSTSLSGAWLLDGLDVSAAETARASRISDMVLQRARQGRRFA